MLLTGAISPHRMDPMEQGFDRLGKLVASDDPSCSYVLTEHSGRPAFYHSGQGIESASMYSFGRLACWAIKADGFDWQNILELVPDPDTAEKHELKAKLMETEESTIDFVMDEIDPKGISSEVFEQIAELFSRLFPAHGHFEDRWNFLSDNFYSFEPSWSFRSYHTAPDFRTLIEEAFGSYRKDIARAAVSNSGSSLAILTRFSSVLTFEQMVELLERTKSAKCGGWAFLGTSFDTALTNIGSFGRLGGALRLRLVHDLFDRLEADGSDGFITAAVVEDTLTMLQSVPAGELKRFRSDRNWDQVHGRAVELASDEEIEGLDPIDFPRAIEDLDGLQLSSMGLKLLRTPLEYLRAGSESGLNNCMGKAGYYTKAKKGESYCLVGYRDMKLVAGIELESKDGRWRVLQLNGPKNAKIEDGAELEDQILLRLNGKVKERKPRSPEPQPVAVDYENLVAVVDPIEPRIERPVRPEGYRILEPIEIPPLGELTGEELEENYTFGAVAFDGPGLVEGELAPPPRIMSLREFNERTDGRQQRQLNFAFPVD